jgi:putative transposase
LNEEERQDLEAMIDRGESKARALTRARILLLADRNLPPSKQLTYDAIAEVLNTTGERVGVICHKYVDMGLHGALFDKPRPGATPKITGEIEAKLVTLACSDPPEGRKRWTLRLLAEQMVELGFIDSISNVAVYKRLKKMNSSLGRSSPGAFPKQGQRSSPKWKTCSMFTHDLTTPNSLSFV